MIELAIYITGCVAVLAAAVMTWIRIASERDVANLIYSAQISERVGKRGSVLNLRRSSIRSVEWDRLSEEVQDRLRSIEVVDLSKSRIEDLRFLEHLEAVRYLICTASQVSNLEPLRSAPARHSVEKLMIDRTQVNSLNGLQNMNELRDVSIARTLVSSLEPVKLLPKLRYIDAANARVTADEAQRNAPNGSTVVLSKRKPFWWIFSGEPEVEYVDRRTQHEMFAMP